VAHKVVDDDEVPREFIRKMRANSGQDLEQPIWNRGMAVRNKNESDPLSDKMPSIYGSVLIG